VGVTPKSRRCAAIAIIIAMGRPIATPAATGSKASTITPVAIRERGAPNARRRPNSVVRAVDA
jgi:hypothetical protein